MDLAEKLAAASTHSPKPSCVIRRNWQSPKARIESQNRGYSDIPGLSDRRSWVEMFNAFNRANFVDPTKTRPARRRTVQAVRRSRLARRPNQVLPPTRSMQMSLEVRFLYVATRGVVAVAACCAHVVRLTTSRARDRLRPEK